MAHWWFNRFLYRLESYNIEYKVTSNYFDYSLFIPFNNVCLHIHYADGYLNMRIYGNSLSLWQFINKHSQVAKGHYPFYHGFQCIDTIHHDQSLDYAFQHMLSLCGFGKTKL